MIAGVGCLDSLGSGQLYVQGPSVCSALDSQESVGLASKDRATTHDFCLFEVITGLGCVALRFSRICAAGFSGLSHCSASDSLRAGGSSVCIYSDCESLEGLFLSVYIDMWGKKKTPFLFFVFLC